MSEGVTNELYPHQTRTSGLHGTGKPSIQGHVHDWFALKSSRFALEAS